MNAKARQLGLHDTHFVRPDGLDAPGHVSSAADVTKLARVVDAHPVRARRRCAEQTATIAGGRTLHTWDDLLRSSRDVSASRPGTPALAGWCQVAAARGRRRHGLRDAARQPDARSQRNDDLESLLVWGLAQFRVVPAVAAGPRSTRRSPSATARRRSRSSPRSRCCAVARVGRPLTETVVAAAGVSLPVRQGDVLGHVEIRSGSRVVGTRDLVASRTINKPGRRGTTTLVRRQDVPPPDASSVTERPPMIVTVTLNAAIDRTLTVPNFQRGQRHRASAGVTLAGGKGINVARDAQGARRPRRRDRPRRRHDRARASSRS